jgi:hypothetical protein
MCNSGRHSGKKIFNVSVPLADSDQNEQVITRNHMFNRQADMNTN